MAPSSSTTSTSTVGVATAVEDSEADDVDNGGHDVPRLLVIWAGFYRMAPAPQSLSGRDGGLYDCEVHQEAAP